MFCLNFIRKYSENIWVKLLIARLQHLPFLLCQFILSEKTKLEKYLKYLFGNGFSELVNQVLQFLIQFSFLPNRASDYWIKPEEASSLKAFQIFKHVSQI